MSFRCCLVLTENRGTFPARPYGRSPKTSLCRYASAGARRSGVARGFYYLIVTVIHSCGLAGHTRRPGHLVNQSLIHRKRYRQTTENAEKLWKLLSREKMRSPLQALHCCVLRKADYPAGVSLLPSRAGRLLKYGLYRTLELALFLELMPSPSY
jgi:hypothetical protein